eukprot:NODE_10624_length_435_cov_1.751295_g9513_i0.p6 GENE.NODE_10624_length_435_cov_1.751295_g9513_i0~~NODE_10624_length_435_cov_1.751295_g9513_i0.p6  ORF type:complete len:50 (+),score=1.86 NODE_10624_length_435_cov_1.751295_g9513_i0:277-426(+)
MTVRRRSLSPHARTPGPELGDPLDWYTGGKYKEDVHISEDHHPHEPHNT